MFNCFSISLTLANVVLKGLKDVSVELPNELKQTSDDTNRLPEYEFKFSFPQVDIDIGKYVAGGNILHFPFTGESTAK